MRRVSLTYLDGSPGGVVIVRRLKLQRAPLARRKQGPQPQGLRLRPRQQGDNNSEEKRNRHVEGKRTRKAEMRAHYGPELERGQRRGPEPAEVKDEVLVRGRWRWSVGWDDDGRWLGLT